MSNQEPSPYLAQHIRDALASGSTAELGVDVRVTPTGVYLSGVVASPAARCAAIKRQCGGKFYANYCGNKLVSAVK
mgnify:CR=1 FL=1